MLARVRSRCPLTERRVIFAGHRELASGAMDACLTCAGRIAPTRLRRNNPTGFHLQHEGGDIL